MPNETWSMDFVHDACANGTKVKVLTIVDNFTRSCPGLLTQSSIPGRKVTAFLDQQAMMQGYPGSIRVDNGPEFTGKHFQQWANNVGFISITLNPENQRITLLSKVSTASFGMNVSTSIGF